MVFPSTNSFVGEMSCLCSLDLLSLEMDLTPFFFCISDIFILQYLDGAP